MLKMFDFECNACGQPFEDLVKDNEVPECKLCQSPDTRRTMPRSFNRPFEVIRATTLTSGPYKAGSVHKYNRPRENISVGWTPALA